MLKKVPDFHCAKALKALSLIRLKRNEEALRILHALKSLQLSDEYSLQAMTFCFLEIKQCKFSFKGTCHPEHWNLEFFVNKMRLQIRR